MTENYCYMSASELDETNKILAETRVYRRGKTVEISKIVNSADFPVFSIDDHFSEYEMEQGDYLVTLKKVE